MMGLNIFRDEAGAFLDAIGKPSENSEAILSMLKDEMAELSISLSDSSQLRHQIYDMLFLLFELASRHNLDLDTEWQIGHVRKQAKYLSSVPPVNENDN